MTDPKEEESDVGELPMGEANEQTKVNESRPRWRLAVPRDRSRLGRAFLRLDVLGTAGLVFAMLVIRQFFPEVYGDIDVVSLLLGAFFVLTYFTHHKRSTRAMDAVLLFIVLALFTGLVMVLLLPLLYATE